MEEKRRVNCIKLIEVAKRNPAELVAFIEKKVAETLTEDKLPSTL